jgi:hypothetical protein
MTQRGAGRRVLARSLVMLAVLGVLAAGTAAVVGLLVGRVVTQTLPVDVGAHRGLVVAVSPDPAENAARIDAVARAVAAGAEQVHVAPDSFDVLEWESQSLRPSRVTVVPHPGVDGEALRADLEESFGPVVLVADHVRWVSDVVG